MLKQAWDLGGKNLLPAVETACAVSGEPRVKGAPKPGHEKAAQDGGDDDGYGHALRAQGSGKELEFQILGKVVSPGSSLAGFKSSVPGLPR